ncbi:MAG: hypothetical protein DME71_06215 [Verrucomicrobia bacterium]|nr:MAG: hypothetical protein DME71_06215 [Verrucomicrobiota bacterium]
MPGFAGNVISLVITRFPILADFSAKRKMIKQGRHVSRNETIKNREHSIFVKNLAFSRSDAPIQ